MQTGNQLRVKCHKIDGKKCEKVIDALMENIDKEKIVGLEKELKIMMELKSLYVQEILSWSYRENSLDIKITRTRKELRKLNKYKMGKCEFII